MKSYVLFDHDGVLVETEPWYFRAGYRALQSVGMHVDQNQYLEDVSEGRGTWAHARSLGVDEDVIDALREVRDAYYQEYLVTEDITIPGVVDTLNRVAESCGMAIVTTSKRADFELIHQSDEIIGLMDFVVLREDYAQSKPNPEPYTLAIAKTGKSVDRILVVEDSQRGVTSAKRAGLDCALVDNHFMSARQIDGADHRLHTLSDLVPLLRGLG